MKPGTVLAAIAIATIFTTGFVYRQSGIDFFAHYAVVGPLILCGFLITNGAIGRDIAIVATGLAAHALWCAGLFGNEIESAALQVVGISAMLAMFWYAARANDFDTERLFSIYLRIAGAVCGFCLLQLMSFWVGFVPGYDLGWLISGYAPQYTELGIIRVQAMMQEPAHLGLAIAPALFVAVLSLTGFRSRLMSRPIALVILATAVTTFSAVAYLALGLSLLLAAFRRGILVRSVGMLVVAVVSVALYEQVPDLKLRVDDTIALIFAYGDLSANLSSLTLYNNAHVAWQALLATNFFGGGLGSHPVSFERFSLLFGLSELPLRHAMLNSADATGLLLRIASELGLPGLVAAALFLVRFYVPGLKFVPDAPRSGVTAAWIVSNASLVFLVLSLLRQGHYFNYGLPFFGLLYLEAGRAYRRAMASSAPRITFEASA